MKLIAPIILLLYLTPLFAEEAGQGEYLGASPSEIPPWFKESFLEFEEDVAEAAAHNKRIMLYFHQPGCPYCARLVEENFTDPEIKAYVQKHFDGIAINMWGDREVVSIGGRSFIEKTFAEALKVQYTPTILFLNEQGKTALRLNGYYPPAKFRLALRYAAEKREASQNFNQFVKANSATHQGKMISEDFFLPQNNLQQLIARGDRYVAVYFEAPDCEDCRLLHDKVLSDKPTRKLATEMYNLQLDIYSDDRMVTVDGRDMTQSDFARELNIGYTPSVVFYNPEGEEVHRIEGFLKTFHFQSSLAYVLEQGYLTQPSFQRYIAARGEKLREMGYDTDIWGYDSFHPQQVQ